MALSSSKLKAEMKQRIYNGLKRVFESYVNAGHNYPPIADSMWELLADAISDAAIDIVNDIQNDAVVLTGIQVQTKDSDGDIGAGQTISLGKIE